MSAPKVSVIICTHNPRYEYLTRVLVALKAQHIPLADWELLLIDNASRELPDSIDLSWHPNSRYVREDELGLAFARSRGVSESRSDLLVFVDDDNILRPDYLSEALRIAREWPILGVWGGSIIAEYEEEPSEEVLPHLGLLAIRQVEIARWSNVSPTLAATPRGAGICVRRILANEFMKHLSDDKIKITGRTGTALLGGEDIEFSYLAHAMGLGSGVFPELVVTHLIPAERVQRSYLIRLRQGMQVSSRMLDFKWLSSRQKPPLAPLVLLKTIINISVKSGLDREMCIANWKGDLNSWRELKKSGLL